MTTPYRRHLESLSFPRKLGQSETRTEVAGREKVETTEHWDGRQDATVYPDVIRYGARVHGTGKKKGEVAEVREMGEKERGERYGDGG